MNIRIRSAAIYLVIGLFGFNSLQGFFGKKQSPQKRAQLLNETRRRYAKKNPAGFLLWAARNGHIDEVKKLLKEGLSVNTYADPIGTIRGTLDPEDTYKSTPLYEAAAGGHFDLVHFLVKEGADIDKGTYSPLLVTRDLNIAKFLISKGCKLEPLNSTTFSTDFSTPAGTLKSKVTKFIEAKQEGSIKELQKLYEKGHMQKTFDATFSDPTVLSIMLFRPEYTALIMDFINDKPELLKSVIQEFTKYITENRDYFDAQSIARIEKYLPTSIQKMLFKMLKDQSLTDVTITFKEDLE